MFTQFAAELIVELTWRYITVIYTDDDYGLSMHSLLTQHIQVKIYIYMINVTLYKKQEYNIIVVQIGI